MDVTLAHEWLISPAGSDKVAARLASVLDATRVVTAIDDPVVSRKLLGARPVEPLWTSRLPRAADWRMRYAPALLGAWATTEVPGDLLVSSTHFGAMGAGRKFDGPHIAYCYSPMRFAWRYDLESRRVGRLAGPLAKSLVPRLQRFDVESSRHVSLFIAISSSIAARIQDSYGRQPAIVHPHVDVDRFSAVADDRGDGEYYLCFGRLVAYKRIDLAVRVCTRRSLPLIVAGDGPEIDRLRKVAGPTVRFETAVSDERYLSLLANAKALLFPGEEDFGIVPVEAMAAGVPVIGFGVGGLLDTVIDGVTGVLFPFQTEDSLAEAIDQFERSSFETAKLRLQADSFRPERFDAELRACVAGHLRSGKLDSWI